MPRGQRDGSLRPYSRFSRQEPLLFYQVAPQLYSSCNNKGNYLNNNEFSLCGLLTKNCAMNAYWTVDVYILVLFISSLCYTPEGRGFDTRGGEILNLPNLSGRTRLWGLLSLYFTVLFVISSLV
jgi:hypothetical protein